MRIQFKPWGTPFTIVEWQISFWVATAAFVVVALLFCSEHRLRLYHEERAFICKGGDDGRDRRILP